MKAQCRACSCSLNPGEGWFCLSCLTALREKDPVIRYRRDVRPKSRRISVSTEAVKVRLIRVQTRGRPRSGYLLSN